MRNGSRVNRDKSSESRLRGSGNRESDYWSFTHSRRQRAREMELRVGLGEATHRHSEAEALMISLFDTGVGRTDRSMVNN